MRAPSSSVAHGRSAAPENSVQLSREEGAARGCDAAKTAWARRARCVRCQHAAHGSPALARPPRRRSPHTPWPWGSSSCASCGGAHRATAHRLVHGPRGGRCEASARRLQRQQRRQRRPRRKQTRDAAHRRSTDRTRHSPPAGRPATAAGPPARRRHDGSDSTSGSYEQPNPRARPWGRSVVIVVTPVMPRAPNSAVDTAFSSASILWMSRARSTSRAGTPS